MNNKINNKLQALVFISAILLLTQMIAAQDQKVRIFSTIPKHIPLKVEFINNDTEHSLDEVKIRIYNTGDKPIYFLSLELDTFEKIGGKKHGFSPFRYGNTEFYDFTKPAEFYVQERKNSESLVGENYAEFQLTKQQVESFTYGLQQKNYFREPKLNLSIYILSFGDKTGFMTASGVAVPEKRSGQQD